MSAEWRGGGGARKNGQARGKSGRRAPNGITSSLHIYKNGKINDAEKNGTTIWKSLWEQRKRRRQKLHRQQQAAGEAVRQQQGKNSLNWWNSGRHCRKTVSRKTPKMHKRFSYTKTNMQKLQYKKSTSLIFRFHVAVSGVFAVVRP